MDSARWQQVQALFHDAAGLPEAEQRGQLKAACGDDDELMFEVLALLDEDARGASVLDRGMAHMAHQVLADEAAPSLALQEFGPYKIKSKLGEGGMGVVYLAGRADLGSQVALKILRDACLSPARRERFESEQRTLAQLNHPSIARLYDADTLRDGTPWFAMEYVEGDPLTEYCRKHRSPLDKRLKLFRLVCEAVQYAHSHAVIHRDLKPSNIFAKEDGSVRLLDFGIAKQLEALDRPVDQTRTELRLMTPAYAAPEQIRGERVGIHTDVYSLGVILYELLAGRLPYDLSNRTPAQAESLLAGHEPEKPSSVVRQRRQSAGSASEVLSAGRTSWADLDVLCLTAMHKDPQRRYRSVEALIRDIDHFLKGEPLEARPDSWSYTLGKFVQRNRGAVAAAAMVFTVVVGLVIFYTVRLTKARNAALSEAARTQRIQLFMLNLFQGGDEAAGPADTLRVVTLLDRGVQEARALDGDPKRQAELYQTLGSIYQKLGKFGPADSLLHNALERRKALFGPASPEAAESLVALGLLRADQAQLPEAERLVRAGLALSRQKLPANHPAVAKATFALGKVLEDRGAYGQAIQVLGEAVRLQSASGAGTPDLAVSMTELANSHFYAGHYDTSDSLNRRVLEMRRQIYGERHPLVADTLINLGAIQFDRGHYRQAERFDRQALDITEAWYGKEHPETADTMTIVGQALTYQHRYGEAAALLERSLGILEHVYGPVHPRVAYALNELGNVAVRRGKLDDAEGYFSRALATYRSVYGDQHYLIGLTQSNLAGVYAKRKEYAQAEPLFREALQCYARTLPADHLYAGITRIRLGSTLAGQHRYAEAKVESLAGYRIVMKQTRPSSSWLQAARQDLAEEYAALNQPEEEAKFRAEFAKNGGGVPAFGSRK